MILDRDTDFHPFDAANPEWAETNFFGFTIPEANIFGQVHLLARPAVGAALVDIILTRSISDQRDHCLYLDSRNHVPLAGQALSDFRTFYGLHIHASDIKNYAVQFQGAGNTSFAIQLTGLMEPFDVQDPAMNPRAKPDTAAGSPDGAFGTAYTNHFDMTCHVTGSLAVRGETFAIDCVETMDHSWGPRPEVGTPPGGWMHAHFGKDLAVHWISKWDADSPDGTRQSLAHGYVMDKGEVFGLVDLTVQARRFRSIIISLYVTAVDVRGKKYVLSGAAMAATPWPIYGDAATHMIRWNLPDGTVGYGIAQDGCSMEYRREQRFGR